MSKTGRERFNDAAAHVFAALDTIGETKEDRLRNQLARIREAAASVLKHRTCHRCSLVHKRSTPATVYGYNYAGPGASHVPRWYCEEDEPTTVLYRQTSAEVELFRAIGVQHD